LDAPILQGCTAAENRFMMPSFREKN
jgi:hypothetical protein